MMKNNSLKNRIVSAVLAMIICVGMAPVSISISALDTGNIIGVTSKEADESTMDTWKGLFGPDFNSTEYAGAVWTDKSVFTDASAFSGIVSQRFATPVAMKDPVNNLLVALSAIASNKSITGYSTIPTDTMIVLDLSGSMGSGSGNNHAIEELVAAANSAISKLQGENHNNRIGIVTFSGNSDFGDSAASSASVLLPLGRYTATGNFLVATTGADDEGGQNRTADYVKIANGVRDADGNTVRGGKAADGGTYTQSGIYLAMKQLLAADTVITDTDNIQAGAQRKPIILLMSDGAPTTANSNYAGSGRSKDSDGTYPNIGTSNMGNGGSNNDYMDFAAQLTASYAKAAIAAHYSLEPLFYTLGFGTTNFEVLNPSKANDTILSLWQGLVQHGTVSANGGRYSFSTATYKGADGQSKTFPQVMNVSGNLSSEQRAKRDEIINKTKNYVNGYYTASDLASLERVFDEIVQEIIIQSRYHATSIEDVQAGTEFDGYITFIDKLGAYMQVKDVQGLIFSTEKYNDNGQIVANSLAEYLHTGASAAINFRKDNGEIPQSVYFGTANNPTENGKNFVDAIMTRIGITDRSVAKQLISLAYQYGQLSYSESNGKIAFSNHIKWLADDKLNYLGFYDENYHEASDTYKNATYKVTSFLYMDPVYATYGHSSMLYCSVRVYEEIATGQQTVALKIPATLIPMVTYEVELEKDSLSDPGNITVTYHENSPIRLVYEVGVRDDIAPHNVAEKIGNGEAKNSDGDYILYSNYWESGDLANGFDPFANENNTYAFFTPNNDNERYYHRSNLTVYTDSGLTNVYNSSTAPEGSGYYHAAESFVMDPSSKRVVDGNAVYSATLTRAAEEIEHGHVSEAKRAENGVWYVPKGLPCFVLESQKLKESGANVSETFDYSVYIKATLDTSTNTYLASTVLGNNGRLTYTPATGLVISKQADIAPGNPDFTFEIKASGGTAAIGSYSYFIVDENGNEGEMSLGQASNGVVTVALKSGQKAYILGLEAGSYTVKENAASGYAVKSITVNGDDLTSSGNPATVTVDDRAISTVDYVNEYDAHGDLVITKTVVDKDGNVISVPESLADKSNMTFSFTVSLENASSAVDGSYTTSRDGETITVTNGKFNISLLAGEQVIVYDLPEGTVVRVNEDLSGHKGFAAPVINGNGATVSPSANTEINVVNTYVPEKVSPVNVSVRGNKTLIGRDWLNSDKFTFSLLRQAANSTEYAEVDSVEVLGSEVLASASASGFSFDDHFKNCVFDKEGVYSFRIVEKKGNIGGITYDETIAFFSITVTDTDLDGSYEISDVDVFGASLDYSNGVYTINASFENTYAPEQNYSTSFEFLKVLQNNTVDQDPTNDNDGFYFGLYTEDGTLIKGSGESDADGYASITMVYTPDDLIVNGRYLKERVYKYLLREILPEENSSGSTYTKDGITYDLKSIPVQVRIVDNLDGTISASIVDMTDPNNPKTMSGNDRFVFTNVYDGKATVDILAGTKQISGRDWKDGESFTFVLYEEDGVTEIARTSVTKDNPNIVFEDISFDKIGEFTFVVKELGAGETVDNLTYSSDVHKITVRVSDPNGNGLLDVQVTDSSASAHVFVNSYYVEPPVTPEPPETGDITASIIGLLLISVIGFAAAKDKKKKIAE